MGKAKAEKPYRPSAAEHKRIVQGYRARLKKRNERIIEAMQLARERRHEIARLKQNLEQQCEELRKVRMERTVQEATAERIEDRREAAFKRGDDYQRIIEGMLREKYLPDEEEETNSC